MGVRVEFWQGAPDGALGHILSSPLPQFLNWYEEILPEEPDEDGAVYLPLIARIVEQGKAAFQVQSREEAQHIDHVVDIFYGWFCDETGFPLLIDVGASALYVSKFEDRSSIRNRLGKEAGRLWDFLLDGRSVGRPDGLYPYRSSANFCCVSFWTYEEVVYLRQCLEKLDLDPHRDSALSETFRAINNVEASGRGLIIKVA